METHSQWGPKVFRNVVNSDVNGFTLRRCFRIFYYASFSLHYFCTLGLLLPILHKKCYNNLLRLLFETKISCIGLNRITHIRLITYVEILLSLFGKITSYVNVE